MPGVERGKADETMNAGFVFEVTVSVGAFDQDRGGFYAGFVVSVDFEDFGFVVAAFRVTEVHAHEHFGPILSIEAAGASVEGNKGVEMIVFAI